ncbi:MAG: hypothetical protein FRX49_01542 [Trebouxia sp. A1-2]|nr:MAG: hypothetical protein FRX49_01542 [Trebouxia sp. A1-2]
MDCFTQLLSRSSFFTRMACHTSNTTKMTSRVREDAQESHTYRENNDKKKRPGPDRITWQGMRSRCNDNKSCCCPHIWWTAGLGNWWTIGLADDRGADEAAERRGKDWTDHHKTKDWEPVPKGTKAVLRKGNQGNIGTAEDASPTCCKDTLATESQKGKVPVRSWTLASLAVAA